ncbi:MAG: hypothetical protein WCB94_06370, partial [Terriglobales bacterium]
SQPIISMTLAPSPSLGRFRSYQFTRRDRANVVMQSSEAKDLLSHAAQESRFFASLRMTMFLC